jgi:pimeloyl-ACP methyl ester carboxylesterase
MPQLPEGFSSHTKQVGDVRMHYVIGGEGDPVVIAHGGWDSWWAWRDVATELANRHTVIMPAIRGLAKTSKPESGYDANTIGEDLHQLVASLGFDRYALVGHDWGAVAAYAATAQHRDAVSRLAIFEMVMPGLGMMEGAMVPQPGGNYLWHMGWHSVPDIPETLIAGHLREYMHWFFTQYAAIPDAIGKESLDNYVDLYSQVGALRAFMKYYQNLWVHGEQVQEHQKQPLEMPVLAYGGEAGLGELTQVCMEALASDVQGGVIPECGHWIAEEQPAFVADRLAEFLDS